MAKSSNSGLGAGSVLFLIFLVLKLAEVGVVAKWSWWWVTSPLWISTGIVLVGFIIGVLTILFSKK